jgi:hypothetical protein
MTALLVIIGVGVAFWYLTKMPEEASEPVTEGGHADIVVDGSPLAVTPIRHGRHRTHT